MDPIGWSPLSEVHPMSGIATGCRTSLAPVLGLAVVVVAAADAETASAIQELLASRWAIAPTDRTTREPGEPGVRLRCFLDLRQEPDA